MTFLVLADDRTGALETAAAIADDRGGSVPVVCDRSDGLGEPVVVVDLGTRHQSPSAAAERSRNAAADAPEWLVHKIDSTLRGNWATELVALHESTGRPALVVPAYPDMGRVAQGGVVFERGAPIHRGPAGADVRGGIESSEPAHHLAEAGAATVRLLGEASSIRRWMNRPAGMAVADASTNDELSAIGAAWAASGGVILAGPSAVVARAAACVVEVRPARVRPTPDGPAVVVCGSRHPSALAQVALLRSKGALVVDAGADDATVLRHLSGRQVVVLVSSAPTPPVDHTLAGRVVAELATTARLLADRLLAGALVVIGGDTADAVLGDQPVWVGGSVTAGSAWGRTDRLPLIVTRSGGFGDASDLQALVSATLGR